MIYQRNIRLITLAGAGRGDPEMITLKLQKRLTEAEVIITDRLVNPEIISSHANKNATILFAGKQGYNDSSYSQEEVTGRQDKDVHPRALYAHKKIEILPLSVVVYELFAPEQLRQ